MLWDKPGVELIKVGSDRRGRALVLGARTGLADGLVRALDLAGFDRTDVSDVDSCMALIRTLRPDVVVHVQDAGGDVIGFRARVETAQVTETLPVLALPHRSAGDDDTAVQARNRRAAECFLKLRAVLRRERPSALRGKRRSGCLTLDEPGFRLYRNGSHAQISKTDLCVLGPFFDVGQVVFDRQSIECLAFAENDWKPGSRSIDAHVSRMRRHVKAQLGIDPLRSVRGVGYRLIQH
ncbi:winged helix-turn-helix domain-containing protein [Rhodobacteraceae bacterium F11138]|nr:winged helix-turn-helix domain-containing protein [Rhodobacteraceae bacterium F11138]